MAIPNYRLTATDRTVIRFREVPRGSPEAIRAWFYPGNTVGQEFVYPKRRATQLAQAAKTVVPAVAVDIADVGALKTAPIVAITPEARELPVTAAIQTTPVGAVATVANSSSSVAGPTGVEQTGRSDRRNARQLPETASTLPLIVLFGLGSLGGALALMVFGKRATASAL